MKYIPAEKRLKRYPKYKLDKDFPKSLFTKFKIVVPTKKDKNEIMAAMEYLHDGDIDTQFVTVNQLVHEYDHGDPDDKYSNIIVDEKLYNKI